MNGQRLSLPVPHTTHDVILLLLLLLLQVTPEGEVLEFLEDPARPRGQGRPSAYRISSAHEHNGKLWLGGLSSYFVSYVDLATLPPKPTPAAETWTPPVRCTTPPCGFTTHYH
jgi:hypothetical protein